MFERINTNLLSGDVVINFRMEILSDNSIRLTNYKILQESKLTSSKVETTFSGEQFLTVNVSKEIKEVNACVLIMRTSPNNYMVVGSTRRTSAVKNCRNAKEVSEFIKSEFIKTLDRMVVRR